MPKISGAQVTNASNVRPLVVPTPDHLLVVAAQEGDHGAREKLFERYLPMVVGLSFRLFPSKADADDLVQDTFVAAFESLRRLKEPAAFAGWLRIIVVQTAHMRLRRKGLWRRLGFGAENDADFDFDQLLSPSTPPDVAAELRNVYRVLDTLPADERVALVLHRVEGWTLDEIAQATEKSLATVKRRIAHADLALQRLAKGGEP